MMAKNKVHNDDEKMEGKDVKEEQIADEKTEEPEIIDAEEQNQDDKSEDLASQLLRLQADFSNFRKRAQKEKQDSVEVGTRRLALALLPVLDNFDRALESKGNCDDAFYDGIMMIRQQLIDALKSQGVEEMNALGESFDPNFHHAVAVEESDGEGNIVLEVMQKGYTHKDFVIRPAMVKVSK